MTSARPSIRTALSAAAICGPSTASMSGVPNSENLRDDLPRNASTMLSRTESRGNRLVIWKVRDTPSRARRCGGRRVISCPSNAIRPAVGGSAPAIALNSVVLPAPLGPMMARRWPRGTVRLTPSTARSASNATTTSESVRIGSDTATFVDTQMRNTLRALKGMIRLSRSRLSFLDPLEGPRVRRLLHVGLGIILPELRDARIARDRHIPVFSIGALHHFADLDVVNRIAVGIELDGRAERRSRQLGLEHRVEERIAVFDVAADLLQRFGHPHHAGIHREAVKRGDLAILGFIILGELRCHRIVGAFGKMGGRDDAVAFLAKRSDHGLIGGIHRAEQREFALEAEACILLDQPRRIRAGFHGEDRIDLQIGQLAEIRTEIGSVERMPELLDDLATAFGEDLGQTAALFVAEGVILADGRV